MPLPVSGLYSMTLTPASTTPLTPLSSFITFFNASSSDLESATGGITSKTTYLLRGFLESFLATLKASL
ncbi:hypothetical protein D1872_324750 [compost metagenome]